MDENDNKFDKLVYLATEVKISKTKLLKEVKELFPSFNPKRKTQIFDKFLTCSVIEQYAYSRALGLNINEAARSVNLTGSLITKVLDGEGVSLDKLVDLVQQILFTRDALRKEHLKNIENNEDNKAASLVLLQTVFPEHYQKENLLANVNVENHTHFTDTTKELLRRKIPLPVILIKDIPEDTTEDDKGE